MSSVSLAALTPFPWRPDWAAGLLERLEWYTDVLQAYKGQEQRRSLRLAPRQQIELAITLSGADRRHMEAVLWGKGSQLFALPLWFDAIPLTATLTAGATSIPLDPALRQFAVGDFLMLIGDVPAAAEFVAVSTITSSIGLSTATSATWPAGTLVVPVRAARIDGGLNFPRFTGDVSSVRLRFECIDPANYTASAAGSYRSLPVFEEQVDWSTDPSMGLERILSVFDSGTGFLVIDDVADLPIPALSCAYTLTSRAAIDTWRKRLYALRGKQGPIWVPSRAADLNVVATISSVATTIDVEWCGYTDNLFGDPNRKDIRIELANGTVLYRRITATSEISATVERLTIDSALGVTVGLGEAVLVSYITLMRLESDAAEFAYWSGDVAETVASFKGFRHDL
jgi:hypothetical protein